MTFFIEGGAFTPSIFTFLLVVIISSFIVLNTKVTVILQ